mmetsp:Transcript_15658/g.49762  ORF Transcript_15658/g.49762 Transcript_15658/m.49762 type:complete len:243 (+) Transcript_15658:919-1647(+)|eukprot:scaffold1151_cov126-Isochrysis_galbana.AAC.21
MLRLLEILCAMLTLIMLLRLLLRWRILRPHAAAPLPLALNWREEVAVRLRTLAACLRTIKRARCRSAASKKTGAATASRAEPATTAAGGSGTHGRRRVQSWRPRALRRVCVLAFAANSLVPRRLLRPILLRQNSLGTDGIQKFLKRAQATGVTVLGAERLTSSMPDGAPIGRASARAWLFSERVSANKRARPAMSILPWRQWQRSPGSDRDFENCPNLWLPQNFHRSVDPSCDLLWSDLKHP